MVRGETMLQKVKRSFTKANMCFDEAEGGRFELPVKKKILTAVFETAALNHYATPPKLVIN